MARRSWLTSLTPARAALIVVLFAVLSFLVLTVFTPTHVSFGAGTLRCGTVFHPAIDSELGHICAQATAEHLRFAEVLSAILAAPALPLRFVRQARPRTLLLVLLAVAAFAALAMLWMAAVYEYSPELMIPV